MCLFQVQHKLTSLHIPFYCFKGSFDRSLNVPVSPGCLVQRIFEDCICVSLFSYQGCLSCDSLFILTHSFSFVKNFFKFFQILFYELLFVDSLFTLSHLFFFVKNFFQVFSKFFELFRFSELFF